MLVTPEKITIGLAQVLYETQGFETVCSAGKPAAPTLMVTFKLDASKLQEHVLKAQAWERYWATLPQRFRAKRIWNRCWHRKGQDGWVGGIELAKHWKEEREETELQHMIARVARWKLARQGFKLLSLPDALLIIFTFDGKSILELKPIPALNYAEKFTASPTPHGVSS